jgi:N-acylglucosamine 2-epimerase
MHSPADLAALYEANGENSLRFWLAHSLDPEHGGYWTCLDRGGQVYDTRKYVWLMGRAVWMFAKAYNELGRRPEHREASASILGFVRRFARREDGRYWFSLERDGRPAFYQRKPYGAVFVCIGLAEFARASGDGEYLDEAVGLFWRIREWIADPELVGRPRHGLSQLADVMVTISMLQEIMPSHEDPRYPGLLNQMLDEALAHQHPELGVLVENIPAAGRHDESYPGGRLWCPGHSAEVSWFLLRILDRYPDAAKQRRVLENLERSLTLGADPEFGGLYYFLDTRQRPMLELEWDLKLWWPHVEAIVAVAHAWRRTGDPRWLAWVRQLTDYSWKTFVDHADADRPLAGTPAGEWFGYAARDGRITHNAKGNHYKGAFHVPRGMLYASREFRGAPPA